MKKGERSFPMAFKVFKFEDQAADSKNKFYRLISALVLQINLNLQKKDGFVKYYEVDEDNTTRDIVLLMEFISMPTLRTYLDCYGAMNLENANVDENFRIKLTDYAYMSVVDKEADFTTEEGCRLDIF
eukprot:CAMPEP_0168325262 /NCGR_PEP_ID=MMETSP0213-20121227/4592_1 /TAXON_ID=151035 /ORGANISM="Euplotes harpa, Strain FSP1.4" /LENGTH=127 /DNA_ID=CAMNT_0008327731 /DNA_START=199 /DNA_END=582 /DNA_ORIENTATION=+